MYTGYNELTVTVPGKKKKDEIQLDKSTLKEIIVYRYPRVFHTHIHNIFRDRIYFFFKC